MIKLKTLKEIVKLKTLKEIVPIDRINFRQVGVTGNQLFMVASWLNLRKEASNWLKADDFEIMRKLREGRYHSHISPISVRAFIRCFFNIEND